MGEGLDPSVATHAPDTFEGGWSAARDVVEPGRPRPGLPAAEAYERHRPELYAFALHATRDHAAAEDAVQEAFVRLVVEHRASGGPTNVRAWLYRVVANLVASRGRRLRVAEQWQPFVATDDVSDLEPGRVVLVHERGAEVTRALATLPPAARKSVILAAAGFSGREVAAALGRTDAAARTLLCRARGRLRAGIAAGAGTAGSAATIPADARRPLGPRRAHRRARHGSAQP